MDHDAGSRPRLAHRVRFRALLAGGKPVAVTEPLEALAHGNPPALLEGFRRLGPRSFVPIGTSSVSEVACTRNTDLRSPVSGGRRT